MLDDSVQLAAVAARFVQEDVLPYLNVAGHEDQYPLELVQKLGSLGFLGMNIPPEFGGLGLDRPTMMDIDVELGRGWLSLGALLGSHLRASFYFLKCGTKNQQQEYLPRLANGELVGAHAYNEQGNRKLSRFRTTLSRQGDTYLLNGIKDWVTNAQNASFMIAIARKVLPNGNDAPVAVIVQPDRPGVHIGKDLPRPGVKGVSLCTVQFNDYVVTPGDLIGGLDADIEGFINTFKSGSSLNFSARAVGASLAVQEKCRIFLQSRDPNEGGRNAIQCRFATMATRVQAALGLLNAAKSRSAIPAEAMAYMTKVFSTEVLQDTIRDGMMLMGGSGYASKTTSLDREYRDAASLLLIDTPNDVLVDQIGQLMLQPTERAELPH